MRSMKWRRVPRDCRLPPHQHTGTQTNMGQFDSDLVTFFRQHNEGFVVERRQGPVQVP